MAEQGPPYNALKNVRTGSVGEASPFFRSLNVSGSESGVSELT